MNTMTEEAAPEAMDEWQLVPKRPTPAMVDVAMARGAAGDYNEQIWAAMLAAAPEPPAMNTPPPKFARGDVVRKRSGSQWQGRVVGEYSTTLTPEGYAVESDTHAGSVQIYPAALLELVEHRDEAQRTEA